MAASLAGDDLSRETSSRRSWRSGSVREMWNAPDVFQSSTRQMTVEEDEEELQWAVIERLPTYDRMRRGMLSQVMSNGKMRREEVDVTKLGSQDKKLLMESILRVVEEDNEKFLKRLRARNDRLTLLLGPLGSGKTTLLRALAAKLDDDLRVTGQVTYCGHDLKEFVPQRTSSYISQHDLHYGEMTVRETLDFSGRCLGVGTRYDLLVDLSRRERSAGIKLDPEIDAFMEATAMEGQETNLITDYVLKILGLDICADIKVGDDMRRGISGGQKKRVTTCM